MHGIIYTYTNTLNGLVYVGQTTQPARRHREYMTEVASTRPNPRLIIQAMQAAGLEAFTYQVLAEASSNDDLNRLEIHYIAMLQANNPHHGYNRTSGGEGGPVGLVHSAEARAKMSLAHRAMSAETRAKMSLAGRGHTVSDETRAKIGLANRGKTASAEHRAKLSLAGRGKTASAETRAKLSLAGRGRTHSAETRAKMSQAARRRAIKKIPPVVHMCVEEGQ